MFGLENAYRDRVTQLVRELEEKLEDLRMSASIMSTSVLRAPCGRNGLLAATRNTTPMEGQRLL